MTKEERRFEILTKVATVITKVLEIGFSIGAVSMTVAFVLFLADRNLFPGTLVKGAPVPGEAIEVAGFSIVYGNPDGTINTAAFIIFLLAGALVFELMAWVWRNANLILRTTQGLTKFSVGKTPFQKDNVRMMREIGIFFISIAVVQFIAGAVAVLVLGPETAEVSASTSGVTIGILMLCLSQVFAIGQKMQEDVDGLV